MAASSSDNSNYKKALLESLDRLDALLGKLPPLVAADVRAKIAQIKRLLLEQRPPALVLIGRRGAGKSSLLNALLGREEFKPGHVSAQTGPPRWATYSVGDAALNILDTRGCQEGSPPAEADDSETALDSVIRELRTNPPDAVLFLVKATEVDAAIDGDIAFLASVLDAVQLHHGYRPAVFGVASKADEMHPKDVALHAPDGEEADDLQEKLDHIHGAERKLRKKLEGGAVKASVAGVVAVCTYIRWGRDGTIRSDQRWGVEKLVELIFRELPEQAHAEFARLTRVRAIQHEVAKTLSGAIAGVCAAIALTPIPLADIGPITSLQVSLIAAIAWLSGRALTTETAAEMLAAMGLNVGGALVIREVARFLINLVAPGAGSLISAGIAYAATRGVGAAAAAYFLDGKTAEEAKEAMRQERDRARAERPE